MRSTWIITIFIIGTTVSCIDPLDIEPAGFDDNLVIQGFINDDFGPHLVRITRVSKFASVREGGASFIEPDAQVVVKDQDLNSFPLKRVRQSKIQITGFPFCSHDIVEVQTDYQTAPDFIGFIGHSYFLEITTSDGAVYRSIPYLLRSTPPIDSLSLEFKILPGLDPINPESGVEVAASWHDPAEEDNYYFWRLNGTYKINTPDRSSAEFCCVYNPDDLGATSCWIIEKNIIGNKLAFSDKMVNGRRVTQSVGFIEDNGLRFADRNFTPANKQYHIEVEQYAISREAFEFNQRIAALSEINGEIFDPPPLSIRGNVFNVNDEEEKVIGFFGAYAKETKGIFVPRSLLEFTQFFPSPCGDCRALAGAQLEIPDVYQ